MLFQPPGGAAPNARLLLPHPPLHAALAHALSPPYSRCHPQVPHDDNRLLLRNGLMMGVVAAMAGCFGLLAVEARRMLL